MQAHVYIGCVRARVLMRSFPLAILACLRARAQQGRQDRSSFDTDTKCTHTHSTNEGIQRTLRTCRYAAGLEATKGDAEKEKAKISEENQILKQRIEEGDSKATELTARMDMKVCV